jgi:DnaK suppressor protein
MTESDVRHFQEKLEVHREEILKMLFRLGDETRSSYSDGPQDFGDLCMSSSVKESLFQQRAHLTQMVRRTEAALHRMRQGEYGFCTACGDAINRKRLEALPWTQYCLRCQEAAERQAAPWPHPAQPKPALGLHR